MALTRAVTDFKDSVKAATTTNVTLSGGAPNTLDGISLSVNDSVLVKDQSTPSQNGVYRVTTLGTGANGTWARRSDFNASNQITAGALVFVEQGSISGNVYYYLPGGLGTVTVDSTSISFSNLYSTIAGEIAAGVYSNSNVASYLPTYSGVLTASSVTTLSGGQHIGYHTGAIGANTANTGAFTTLSTTGNITAGGNINITGNILPSVSNTYSLGSSAFRFANLWLKGTTIYIGSLAISDGGGYMTITDAATGSNIGFQSSSINNTVIGNTNPAAGTFTTLTATSGYQGAASGPLNGTVGATTANTGAFTTITASSTLNVTGTAAFAGTLTAATLSATTIGNSSAAGTFSTLTSVSGYQGAASGPLNGTLGATTPNTVIATSVTTTSGGQLTGYHTGAIGANTANSGAFTTLTTTSTANVGNLITTGGVFWANGNAYSSGSGSSTVKFTTSATAPTLPNVGDFWYNSTTDILYQYINDGSSNFWYDLSTVPTTFSNLTITGTLTANNFSTSSINNTPIGNLTPATGAFTTLTATSGYQGAASGPLNGTLGATTPNTVVATSVTTTSAGQITGYHTGAIGANTANSGVFTSVTTTSGGQLTGYHTGAIGANTANSGAFTTLSTTGNVSLNNYTNLYIATGSATSTSALTIAGNINGQGGVGYLDILKVTNTYSAATNPNKYLRLNSTGGLEIVNSGYSSTIFILADSGDLQVSGKLTMSTGVFWANGTAYSSGGSGGSTSPGGANTYVQFNDVGTFGGSATFTFNKTSGLVTSDSFAATNNGAGTNFKVGDDAWIGDINVANTMGIKGQEDGTQGYIVFGNSNNTTYIGRSGTNPITVTGSFTVTSAATAASVTTTSGGQISGYITGPIGANTANTGAFTTITSTSTIIASGNIVASSGTTSTSTTTGSLVATGGIGAAGNVYVGGNIFQGGRRASWTFVQATTPTGPVLGDSWYKSGSDILYQYVNDGTSSFWIDLTTKPSTFANVSVTSNLSVSGNVTTSLIPSANNTYNLGSTTANWSTVYAVTFSGTSTTAKYADLAENYTSDKTLIPGQVVVFGGEAEVTLTSISHDRRIAGVVSTNPAYLMNSELRGYSIALTGRVPCYVKGPIEKGDMLASSSFYGVAIKVDDELYKPGCVIGKSLENISTDEIKQIEVVVGRF